MTPLVGLGPVGTKTVHMPLAWTSVTKAVASVSLLNNCTMATREKGDLAPPTLTDGLLAAGYRVEARTAYRTHGRAPDPDVRDVLLAADALTLASGSAARSWADAVGTATPPVVVAIGPTTEAAAADAGIVVTHVAATHDLEGLAEAVVAAFEGPP